METGNSPSESLDDRFSKMWKTHRNFIIKTMNVSAPAAKVTEKLDADAKAILAAVDAIRPEIDSVETEESHRRVRHGGLSVFQCGVADYWSKGGHHADAFASAPRGGSVVYL